MVLVNYTTRELTAKLVYYGPGLCGKTTNLQYIFEHLLPEDRRGKMVSLATETDRTLFFDFLPLEIGTIRGLKTRLQLYTVPGQVHYNATRKIVLKGADGIVFVADSQATMKGANLESYQNMKANLAEHGLDLEKIPHVFQFNKRDLDGAMSVEEMEADLNEFNAPFWEAVAVQGIGVEDTLKSVVKLVLKNLATRFQPEGAGEEAEAGQAPVTSAGQPPVAAPVEAEPVASAEPVVPEAVPTAEPVPEAMPHLAPESPLLAPSGELLSLEFPGNPAETIVATDQDEGDEEILEVGEGDLLPDDEESPSAPAADLGELGPPDLGGPSPLAAESAPPAGAEPVLPPEPPPAAMPPPLPQPEPAEAVSPFGEADEPPMETPGTGGGDEPFGDLGAPLGEPAPPPELDLGALPAGEELAAPLDDQARALRGDTILSPEPLEGLATEADLPGAAPAAIALEPVDVGAVGTGRPAERTLRLPVRYRDAAGEERERVLEIHLRLTLD